MKNPAATESETETITGRIDSLRYLPGWARDVQIMVGGSIFYQRIGTNKVDISKLRLGDVVRGEYEHRTTVGSDCVIDRLLFASFGIPQSYREIIKIERVKKA